MKACVFGAGSIGGHLAVRLALRGHEVSVVARGQNLDAIKAGGLTLETATRSDTVRVPASRNPADFGVQDVVVVTTKANALEHIELQPLIGRDSLVVFVQNGMPWWYPLGLPPDKPSPPKIPLFDRGAALLRWIRQDQIIGATINSANQVIRPGLVKSTSPKSVLRLAHVNDATSDRLTSLRNVLDDCGISSPATDRIRAEVWAKLLRNASSSTIALILGMHSSVVKTDDLLSSVFERIVDELMLVSAAHGFPLDDRVTSRQMLDLTEHVVPSMLQDYQQNRPLEIDEILIAPLSFAESAGIDVPALRTVAALASTLARSKNLYR